MPVKIKDSYADVVIGFNNSSLPLGKRKDLHKLYEFAKQTGNRKYLNMFEETPGELAEALDFLQAKDFINEQRVVESVVNSRSRKLGASRVRQELQAKGLPVEAIAEAVQEMRSTELERAREVWRKKFGAPPADQAARVKQVRFLVSRGFAPEVVRKVVAGAEDF